MGKAKGESRGLAYLQQVRPEAVRHLLKFFRESGQHLEPRTRFLISIVTKVINLSPRGLQQYVRRALDEGASADEIIDAVLCAYPCAGLTRVVDAIDVILDMKLPEFEGIEEVASPSAETSSAPAAAGEWREIATGEELGEDGRLEVNVGDRTLAVFRIDGEILVIDGLCPHRSGPLIRGQVQGRTVTCPLHHWQFELESGVCQNNPGAKVGTYEVRVEEDGRILVRL
jgi:NAD(P)H-dependent nitrite reductase small subunit